MKDLLELLAFVWICLTKEDVVINKQKVGDTSATSTNGDACEEMISDSLMNNSLETLSTKEEETGRKGISLSKSSRWSDVSKGSPIYND